MTFEESMLWKSTLGEKVTTHAREQEILRNAYMDMREKAATLVGNISADLSEFTIHDITHVDALWGVASELVGDEFKITPTEGFVLGGAFLLHDAGMCLAAYPGGLEEIQQHPLWPAIFSKFAKGSKSVDEQRHLAVKEILRIAHAEKARDLPNIEWSTPDGKSHQIMEKTELQQKFGEFIGLVAASHWWSHERVNRELNRIIPAPPPFPTEWSIDLLKIAAVLRVADAAHVDERRAPGFAFAQRALGEVSRKHWLFQNRLTQPERRGDAVWYSATAAFSESEAEAWWLAYDTLKMIDEELRRTDVMLADLRGDQARLAARRVANAESPRRMMNMVQVSGWIPLDTNIRITDVPALIKKLGGEALYGQDRSVPLRELVQNAIDATRLKAKVLELDSLSDIDVRLEKDNDRWALVVSDHGVGMSEEIITNFLLDFGESGWRSHASSFENYDPSFDTIGKFGIGFFSVFMIGDELELRTRQFDRSFDETLVLSFKEGINRRPILRRAHKQERLVNGGTVVKVWLRSPPDSYEGFLRSGAKPVSLHELCENMFPAIEATLVVSDGSKKTAIGGGDWMTISAEDLIARTGIKVEPIRKFINNLRPIYDENNQMIGRAFVCRSLRKENGEAGGVVCCKGVAVTRMTGLIGVIEGDVVKAARDLARPRLPSTLPKWLRDQAELLSSIGMSDEEQCEHANVLRGLGGDTGNLKICQTKDGWANKGELERFINERDEVFLVHNAALNIIMMRNSGSKIADNVISVDVGWVGIHERGRGSATLVSMPKGRLNGFSDGTIQGIVAELVCELWGIDADVASALCNAVEDGHSVYRATYIVAESASGEALTSDGVILFKGMSSDDLLKYRHSK